jgi:hypothetical protein
MEVIMWSDEIIAAIIAGFFAIVAAVVPNYFNVKIKRTARGARDLRQLLPGEWAGSATEIQIGEATALYQYEVHWDFSVRGRKIFATSSSRQSTESGPSISSYSLTGIFLHDRFIQLEYSNDNNSEVNFGTEVLHIDDTGKHFVGKFVGYSSERSAIISGTIEGTKM